MTNTHCETCQDEGAPAGCPGIVDADSLMCMNKQIKNEAEKVLASLNPKDFPFDAINWGDLKVVDVISCRSLAEGVYYEILIDEAAEDACNLHRVVIERMPKHAFPIHVRTEW